MTTSAITPRPTLSRAKLREIGRSSMADWHARFIQYVRLTSAYNTMARYDHALDIFRRHFRNKTNPAQFTRQDIEDYRVMRNQEGVSNRTINLEMAAGKAFFDFIIRGSNEPLINPFKVQKKLPVAVPIRRAVPLDIVSKLMDKAQDDPKDALVATLAFTTGMRGDEMLKIEKRDFDFAGKRIILRPEIVKGKKKGRVLPLRDDLAVLVKALPEGRVLHGIDNYKQLLYRFKNLCWKAEVPVITLHAARHAYATNLLRAGADIATVRDLLGHTSIATTGTYLVGWNADESHQFLDMLPKAKAK